MLIGRLLLAVEAGSGGVFVLFLWLAVGLNNGLGDGSVQLSIGALMSATGWVLFVLPLLLLALSLMRSAAVPWAVSLLQIALAVGVVVFEVAYQPGPHEPNILVGWASVLLLVVAVASAWCFLNADGRRYYSRAG